MKCLLALLILTISLVANACSRSTKTGASLSKIKVRSDGFFVDSSRRVRIFHGFNAVNKGFPWYPTDMSNSTIVQRYKEWGFNAVRLGTMWSGVEPKQGQFNETYLNIIKSQVQHLANSGLYTFMDMHQDVLAKRYGTYDGAPSWLVDMLPKARYQYPWPWNSTKQFAGANWALQYLTEGCSVSFQGLYDNVNGSQDLFVRFWKKVAQALKDVPSVLGYELINEPWAGNVFGDPFLFEPGVAGKKNLFPMYDKLQKGIREIDNETIIMYEPVTWGVFLNGKKAGTGFDTVPGGPDYRDRSVLSYHLYCWIADASGSPFLPWQSFACDDLLAANVIQNAHDEFKRTGGGGFLTEFGNCEPDGKKNSSNTVLCETVMDLADKHIASWTYWDSDFYWANGKIRWDLVRPFVRAYPRAIAGTPLAMSFDANRFIMDFKYELDPTIKEPTEIFVPPMHYPKGFKLTTSDQVTYTFDNNDHVLFIKPRSTITKATIVTVNIVPNL